MTATNKMQFSQYDEIIINGAPTYLPDFQGAKGYISEKQYQTAPKNIQVVALDKKGKSVTLTVDTDQIEMLPVSNWEDDEQKLAKLFECKVLDLIVASVPDAKVDVTLDWNPLSCLSLSLHAWTPTTMNFAGSKAWFEAKGPRADLLTDEVAQNIAAKVIKVINEQEGKPRPNVHFVQVNLY